MKKLKKNNLIDMDIKAVALVDKGANKKTFFLLKRDGGSEMNKEQIIKLIKAGDLSEEQLKILKEDLTDEESTEVDAAVEAEATEKTEEEKKAEEKKAEEVAKKKGEGENEEAKEVVAEIVEKAGAKFSKQTMAAFNELKSSLSKISSLIEKLTTKPEEKPVEKTEEEKKAEKKKAEEEKVEKTEEQKIEDVKKMIEADEDIPEDLMPLAEKLAVQEIEKQNK